jgi:putative tryptophan/tyrosine transport system substrate-binding protein
VQHARANACVRPDSSIALTRRPGRARTHSRGFQDRHGHISIQGQGRPPAIRRLMAAWRRCASALLLCGLSSVAILFNPTNRYMPLALESARKGAQVLHVSLAVYEVYDTITLDAAFVTLTKDRPNAFLVPADTFLVSQRSRIAQFAIENKLPSVYSFREYIEAGGLIAYTPNYDDLFRRAASYVDKILKGAKPGELPIERPSTFQLFINLKTARALGLTVPPKLLAAADEVIE